MTARQDAPCKVPGCPRPVGKGYRAMCWTHYQNWRLTHRDELLPPGRREDDPGEPGPCQCETPAPEPILLFGWVRVVDVHQCANCHRAVMVTA